MAKTHAIFGFQKVGAQASGWKRAALARSLPAALALGALPGCMGEVSTLDAEEQRVAASQQDLVAYTNVTFFTANNNTAHVCFLATTPDFASEKAQIRDAIRNTWGRYSGLHLEGFETCPASVPSSWIPWLLIQGTGPTDSAGHGFGGVGARSDQFPNAQLAQDVATDRSRLIGTALHEFGHVLGFDHEHQRTDHGNVAGCGTPPDPFTVSGNFLTNFDHKSVMDSCRDRDGDGQTDTVEFFTLSEYDILGLQKIYGRKPSGSIVSMNNQCVDIPNNTNPPTGQDLQVYDCNNGANQAWKYDTFSHKILAKNVTNGNSTMDIRGGSTASNTPVQLITTTGGFPAKQSWQFKGVELLGIGNVCLDRPPGENRIQTFSCHGGSNQRWDIEGLPPTPSIRIRAAGTSTCITVPSGATAGTDLQLAPCSGSPTDPTQVFKFTSFGEIKAGTLCFDTELPNPLDTIDGRPLQVYTCADTARANIANKLNQLFTVRGQITSGLNTCLTTPTTNFQAQDQLRSFACSTTPDFTWEYYFAP